MAAVLVLYMFPVVNQRRGGANTPCRKFLLTHTEKNTMEDLFRLHSTCANALRASARERWRTVVFVVRGMA